MPVFLLSGVVADKICSSPTFQGREKKLNKFDQSGLSMEELERMQAEAFSQAAARHN